MIRVPYSQQKKKEFFDFTLPSSRHTLQRPMYRAFEAREGERLSLPSPSRQGSPTLTRLLLGKKNAKKSTILSCKIWRTPIFFVPLQSI